MQFSHTKVIVVMSQGFKWVLTLQISGVANIITTVIVSVGNLLLSAAQTSWHRLYWSHLASSSKCNNRQMLSEWSFILWLRLQLTKPFIAALAWRNFCAYEECWLIATHPLPQDIVCMAKHALQWSRLYSFGKFNWMIYAFRSNILGSYLPV